MDKEDTIHSLKERVAKFRDDRDWMQFHDPKDLSISIALEAAELMELFQWKHPEEIEKMLEDEKKANSVEEELADIIIYCLSLTDRMNLDLSEAVKKKIKKNEEKYPVEKAKGSSRKYTELKE
ncbi:nucleotide pyrophosphohydrolase [archaeon]|nr:nucleotide pyrophosphohydrolase [archaeon]